MVISYVITAQGSACGLRPEHLAHSVVLKDAKAPAAQAVPYTYGHGRRTCRT